MEKRELSYTDRGNVDRYSYCGDQYGNSFKKLNIELPYNPTVPLLGIYPVKTITQKDTCTPMFIAAPFMISRTWKQPRCPSTDKWIKQIWYI